LKESLLLAQQQHLFSTDSNFFDLKTASIKAANDKWLPLLLAKRDAAFKNSPIAYFKGDHDQKKRTREVSFKET
jgi:hypothetical protein